MAPTIAQQRPPSHLRAARLDRRAKDASMHRTGLIVGLSIAAIAGLAFGVFPSLDLDVSALFYPVKDSAGNMFAWRISPTLLIIHDIALNAGFVLVAPALIALVVKLLLPRTRMLISGRAIVFLVSTMLLAPGLLVNVALKDHWGRPRPIDVTQFGGQEHFVPWWSPRGDCPNNCSFVSGDVSTVAWTFAPAALVPGLWLLFVFVGVFVLSVF